LLEKGAANFPLGSDTEDSPLAKKLFGVSEVHGVMIGRNFITLTKSDAGEWDQIYKASLEIISSHLKSDESVVSSVPRSTSSSNSAGEVGEAETKIRQILDDEIRPAVARDGGDITFSKFEDGIVYLYMQGACSGCPSSTMTLKMGIENRLKEVL